MAALRLRGRRKPKVAAQISRLDEGCYPGVGDQTPSVNGKSTSGATLPSHGDLIEVCGVKSKFAIHK
jgi:hypothetical protein